jgi:hypothetical protein
MEWKEFFGLQWKKLYFIISFILIFIVYFYLIRWWNLIFEFSFISSVILCFFIFIFLSLKWKKEIIVGTIWGIVSLVLMFIPLGGIIGLPSYLVGAMIQSLYIYAVKSYSDAEGFALLLFVVPQISVLFDIILVKIIELLISNYYRIKKFGIKIDKSDFALIGIDIGFILWGISTGKVTPSLGFVGIVVVIVFGILFFMFLSFVKNLILKKLKKK